MKSQWYAVRTRSRHEEVAAELLQRKTFSVFLPKITCWSKRKDRKKKILKPLFPGYFFVHFELTNEQWLEIKKTHGVVDLVSVNKKPAPIPDEQILSVRSVVESGMTFINRPYLNRGDKVLVVNGSLKGATGIFLRDEKKKGKLVVSVDLLNRSLEVEMDETDVDRF